MPGRNRDEETAKQWQVKNVEQLAIDIKNMVEKANARLDDFPKTFVTKEQLEAEKKLIHERYGPMKNNIKWVTRAVAGVVVAAIVQLVNNIRIG